MPQPDFDAARQFALDRLARELAPSATYHSLRHTRDVMAAAERLAALEGVRGDNLLCLLTATAYHDVGYIDRPDDHEAESARVAAEALPRFGYTPEQIRLIAELILATKWPPKPRTLLERIIADSDLDSLGREDFLTTNSYLRTEMAAAGEVMSDAEWNARQLDFLANHRYFTDAARQLRDEGKQRNMAHLRALLDGQHETPES